MFAMVSLLYTSYHRKKKILLLTACRLVKIIKYLELLSQKHQNIFILLNDFLEDENLLYITKPKIFSVKRFFCLPNCWFLLNLNQQRKNYLLALQRNTNRAQTLKESTFFLSLFKKESSDQKNQTKTTNPQITKKKYKLIYVIILNYFCRYSLNFFQHFSSAAVTFGKKDIAFTDIIKYPNRNLPKAFRYMSFSIFLSHVTLCFSYFLLFLGLWSAC